MSTLLIAVWALAATPATDTPGPTNTPVASQIAGQSTHAKAGSELREAIQTAIRRWSHVRPEDCAPAVREFLTLYADLQQDKQLSASVREELRCKLRRRLRDLAAQLSARPALLAVGAKPDAAKSVIPPDGRDRPLAQRGANGPRGNAAVNQPGGQNMLAADDLGADLADLIQHVIAPESWDVNGGLGTIYYWPPSRAMVVRQTEDVHDQIGEVLLQLRMAGQ